MISWILNKIRNHSEVITDLDLVTPRWLTLTLSRNGYLPSGKVVGVQRELWKDTELSLIVRFKISYSSDAPTSLPSRLLLKLTKPNISSKRASLLGQKENEFYTGVASAMRNSPAPRCYDAFYSQKLGKSHILLEDLSETHFQPKHPLPPSKLQAEQDVNCLAILHAHWWKDPRLGQSVGKIPTDEDIHKRASTLNKQVANFVSFLGDRLSVKRRKTYEDALSFYPKLLRLQRDGNLTLVHGDAHCWNFLNPIEKDKATTRIIDWEFWSVDVGTNDLAFMIAVHWYPEMRASLEKELLRRYYSTLVSCGVGNYEWDDCWTSYRLSVIKHLFTPVLHWANGLSPRIWWHNLERIMTAFFSLQCAELY